jgi:hypothetical protein
MGNLFNQNKESVGKTSSYLFQIHQSNFNCYFDNGILAPSSYIKDNLNEDDIQSQYPNHLVLSENVYIQTKVNQLFFEILLTNEEIENLTQRVKQIYLYSKPLPISRIENIYYTDENYKLKMQKFVESGSTSYIPFSIMSKLPSTIKYKKECKIKSYSSINYLNELNRYDKIMGMFSYIKNTNLYYNLSYSNYSSNYLSALATINKYIRENYDIHKGYFTSFQRILKTSQGSTNDIKSSKVELLETIYNPNKNIDKNYVVEFFNKYKGELNTHLQDKLNQVFMNIKDPLKKKENLRVLASDMLSTFFEVYYIANYGERINGTNKLKSAITKELPYKKAEITLALLGIYYGYKRLDSYDTIDKTNSTFFKGLIDSNHNVKFKLDNRLDYVTIESIYQFVFNNNIDNGQLDYLVSPENHRKSNYKQYKDNNRFGFKELKIFDESIVSIFPQRTRQISKNVNDKVLTLLNRYPNQIFMSSTIFTWVVKTNYGIIRFGNTLFIDKNELIQHLKKGNTKNIDYLLECIEFDFKHNNL